MREKLQRFMIGRYGVDEFGKKLNTGALVCLVISMFASWFTVLRIFYWVGIGLMIYNCYRMFSRDVAKRCAENQKFLSWRYQMVVKRDKMKKRWEQRGIYRFYKCPQCRQTIRVPKGRGRICITCPKCRTEFIKKS